MSKTTRVRGFAPWTPSPASAALVAMVNQVLAEYADFLPLTLRQIFYRLIGAHGYPKGDGDYKRLGEILNRARRARLVPFGSIRDDGFTRSSDIGWSGPDDLKATVRHMVEHYQIDRQRGQDQRLVVWCEAQGMVPQLERVSLQYSVPVFSTGGFDSVCVKEAIASEFAHYGQSVTVLHIGDYDWSGEHVFTSLAEDVGAFVDSYLGGVEFIRLALTLNQIDEYSLPTTPHKSARGRETFHDGRTAQAEALPPDVLAAILRDAIEDHFDMDAYAEALTQESAERAQLIVWAQR